MGRWIIRCGLVLFFQLVVEQTERARLHHLPQHRFRDRLELVVVVDVDVQPVHHIEVRVGKELLHRGIFDARVDAGGDETGEVGLAGELCDVLEGGPCWRLGRLDRCNGIPFVLSWSKRWLGAHGRLGRHNRRG